MALPYTFTDRIKQQRLVLTSALIVAIALIFLARAPIVPTVLGCLAVIVWSFVRSSR
jgi:hypothetical protein